MTGYLAFSCFSLTLYLIGIFYNCLLNFLVEITVVSCQFFFFLIYSRKCSISSGQFWVFTFCFLFCVPDLFLSSSVCFLSLFIVLCSPQCCTQTLYILFFFPRSLLFPELLGGNGFVFFLQETKPFWKERPNCS